MSNKILGIDVSRDVSPELTVTIEDDIEHIVHKSKSGKISRNVDKQLIDGKQKNHINKSVANIDKHDSVVRETISIGYQSDNSLNKEIGE